MRTTRKNKKGNVPWAGWHKEAPFGKERTEMFHKCGKKCFLGKHTPTDKLHPDFPICTKNTCKVNTKGLWAAYVRAREWGNKKKTYKGLSQPRHSRKTYKKIANKARKMLNKRGFKVGK